ncbi:hypothetical protein [Paraburkholderia sp. CI3]|uniref:hypothetical protein n=1 Tax=Paraburkholderia sp. CI3 TaxID=2991060 RepID=UPI003D25D5B2
MSTFELSSDEANFCRSIEDADVFTIVVECDGTPNKIIRAEAIRRIFFGIPVCFPGKATPRVVKLRAQGIHLARARIEGTLFLDDMAGQNGIPSPPLVLRGCVISMPIYLRRAQLQHLSLSDCKIKQLVADGAHIYGSVVLTGLGSVETAGEYSGANDEGCCWVLLRGTTIDGSVAAGEARLVAPRARRDYRREIQPANYAIDLSESNISGALLLTPNFTGIGGVCISRARIGQNCVGQGSVIAVEESAFNARRAMIGGEVILRPVDTVEGFVIPFKSDGDVDFSGAKIDGSVAMMGAELTGAFSARDSKIGANVYLSVWQGRSSTQSFSAKGGVWLDRVDIAGNLELYGASVHEIAATDADIGGSASLCDWFGRDGPRRFNASGAVGLWGAKIAGNLNMHGASVRALAATNIEVRGSAFLCGWSSGKDSLFAFSARNGVGLWNAKIGIDLDMRGALVDETTEATDPRDLRDPAIGGIVAATGAEVGGNVFFSVLWGGGAAILSSVAVKKVWLDGAKIRGDLDMRGANVGGVAAENAEIGGEAFFGVWLNESSPSVQSVVKGRLSLRGARITNSLHVFDTLFESESKQARAEVDLRNLHTTILDDGDGMAWEQRGRRPVLRLEGFEYSRLQHNREAEPVEQYGWRRHVPDSFRIFAAKWQQTLRRVPVTIWVSIFYAASLLAILSALGYIQRIQSSWLCLVAFLSLVVCRFAEADFLGQSAWQRRLEWLSLQYTDPSICPASAEYTPDPYERLTAVFRAEGSFEDARRITQKRLAIERHLRVFVLFRWIGWLYEACFNSGLAPGRALATFTGCIIFGTLAVSVADHGVNSSMVHRVSPMVGRFVDTLSIPIPSIRPVLVVETTTVTPYALVSNTAAASKPAFGLGTPENALSSDLPCGDQIEPSLYALDIFVPALEVHQESKCGISTEPAAIWWRIGKAAYAVLGWIVTSLTVLTVSGVLRRHLEA